MNKVITLKKLESYNTLTSLRRIDKSQSAVSFDPVHFRKWYTVDTDVRLEKYGYNLQRPFVWTLLQQQELIWSIFMGRPIPPFQKMFCIHSSSMVTVTSDISLQSRQGWSQSY